MQSSFVNGTLVKLSPMFSQEKDKKRTGMIVSVQETNTSSLGSPANWYPHVYYVLFNDSLIKGPLFYVELECL